MLLRALVVLLLILNLGAATWWATRGAPDGPAPVVLEAGVPRLQLAGEAEVAAAPSAAVAATPVQEAEPDPDPAEAEAEARAPVATATVAPLRCLALGPYPDAGARDAARARLTPLVARAAPRDVTDTPRGWRVWLPPQADRAAAQAVVARLVAAGFDDYYVIAEGEDANGVALGRFGSEAGATSRATALRAAGFDVQSAPLGSTVVRHWIDLAVADDAAMAPLRAAAGAARLAPRDCNASGDAG